MMNLFLRYFSKDEVYCARVITGFSRPQRHISEITVYTEPILFRITSKNADPDCFRKNSSNDYSIRN